MLAAGAIRADSGFRYALSNGADFICVGMSDLQVEQNVSLVQSILPQSQNRPTGWRDIPEIQSPIEYLTELMHPQNYRGMKPIKIKNEYGETIEIKYDAEGNIKIRHSDVDPKYWGQLHEYAKRMRQPKVRSVLASKAIDLGVDLNSPEAKRVVEIMGGYMVLRGKSYIINAEELNMIYDAIRQAGGIIPNWSNRS